MAAFATIDAVIVRANGIIAYRKMLRGHFMELHSLQSVVAKNLLAMRSLSIPRSRRSTRLAWFWFKRGPRATYRYAPRVAL